MAETSNTYITCYIKKGKVVEQFFLNSQDEATTMEALGRKKGYETETLVMTNDWLPSRSVTEVESTLYVSPKKQKVKKYWDRPVKCVETGLVRYSSLFVSAVTILDFPTSQSGMPSTAAMPGTAIISSLKRHGETWNTIRGVLAREKYYVSPTASAMIPSKIV